MSNKKNIENTDRSQLSPITDQFNAIYKEEGYTQKIQKSSGELGGEGLVN